MSDKTYHKMAFMGGAYGNLPALKACVEDAKNATCDGLFFLGDAIGFAGHSDETIEFILENFDVFIAGNLESQAAGGYTSCACGYGAAEDEITGCRSFEWSLKSLSEKNKIKLGALPLNTTIICEIGKIFLCHGSPDIQNEFLYESTVRDEQLLHWLSLYDAIGIICTHTGLPWTRQLGEGKFAVNCGVTGKPDHDGDTAVHYAIWDTKRDSFPIIRSVNYNNLDFALKLQNEGVEAIFIEPLRTGIWTCGVKSLPLREQTKIKPDPVNECS